MMLTLCGSCADMGTVRVAVVTLVDPIYQDPIIGVNVRPHCRIKCERPYVFVDVSAVSTRTLTTPGST